MAACQGLVRAQLRAPEHAQFTGTPDVSTPGDTLLAVYGTIEAMNGFGGYGRVSYWCIRGIQETAWDPRRVQVFDTR